MSSLDELIEEIVAFRDERDWAQFHRPEQLANALSIETAELQELFLSKTSEEVQTDLNSSALTEEVRRKLADVAIFCLLLSHELEINLTDAVRDDLQENREKYPVDEARGRAAQYTEYKDLDCGEPSDLPKLVRNKIPELIRQDGGSPSYHTAEPNEYETALKAKLKEEVAEFLEDGSLEELADLLEVIHAIASASGHSFFDIERHRVQKEAERGNFDNAIILDKPS